MSARVATTALAAVAVLAALTLWVIGLVTAYHAIYSVGLISNQRTSAAGMFIVLAVAVSLGAVGAVALAITVAENDR